MVDFFELPEYEDSRVVILNRTSIEGHDALRKAKEKHGFRLIVDLDDFWNLYFHHHDYASWINNMVPKSIVKHLHLADVVTVTNTQLADEVKKTVPSAKVEILPNALPYDRDQFKVDREEADTLRFFYAGGASHAYDIGVLREAIQLMNAGHVGHEFILAGYKNAPDSIKEQWDNMMRVFHPGQDPSGWPIRKAKKLTNYMELYEEADVVLAPLEDNRFNRCKSNLKILEAGCKNAAVLASCIPPYYNDLDKDFVTYAEGPRSWYEIMRLMLKNPTMVKEQGLALGAHVREHYHLDKVNIVRRQIVESLL